MQIANKINNLWKAGISKDGSHIFFKDMEDTLQTTKDFRIYNAKKHGVKNISNKIVICKRHKNLPKIKSIKMPKVSYGNPLTKKDIYDFDKFLYSKIPTDKAILKYINNIRNRPLPSDINLEEHIEYLKKSKNKKVLILGGGPNGLFLSLMLTYIYNRTYNGVNNTQSIDILLLDNRIVKEGFRQPYSRNRTFAFSDFSLAIIYQYLYCTTKNYAEPIKYIEYLAYTKAFMEDIPMYFTKKYEKWNEVIKLMELCKFDILFDATGGRLNVPDLIPSKYTIKTIEKDDREIVIDKNEVILKTKIENDPLIYIFDIKFYDKNKNLLLEDAALFTLHTCDIATYKHYSDVLLSKKDVIKISEIIEDKLDAKILRDLVEKKKDVTYFELNPITVYMHHKIKIAEVFRYKNYSFLYIGSGDTIFHSHFITGSGINRLFNFIIRILYIIQ